METKKTLESEFIDFIIQVNKSFGLDSLSSRLSALIYLSPVEISMDDLSKKTGYSLASISNKMKIIENTGKVKKIKKPGSKKIYYYMDKKISDVIKQHMEKSYAEIIHPATEFLPILIKKYENTSNNEKEILKMIKNYYKEMITLNKSWKKMLDLLEKNDS